MDVFILLINEVPQMVFKNRRDAEIEAWIRTNGGTNGKTWRIVVCDLVG